jgi:putative ABC transport system ATP-binding protein
MLKLENVTKVFLKNTPDEVTALSGINLAVEEGNFVTIIGSNGAGKSTLLQAITGFVIVDEGTIEVMEKDVTRTPPHQRAKYIGRIAQNPGASVCGVMTIEENLAMADLRGRRRGLRVAVTSKNRPHFSLICFCWTSTSLPSTQRRPNKSCSSLMTSSPSTN